MQAVRAFHIIHHRTKLYTHFQMSANESPMFGGQGTMDPNAMNNNLDFSSFFDNLTPNMTAPTGNTPGAWGMDQFVDFPNYNTTTTGGFPFPQQSQENNPFGITPHATNSFTAMNTAMNPANMMALQSANGLSAQTADPNTLMESSNTSSTGYSTRQATGSSQKRPMDSIEGSLDSPPKKVRKQRKKRSKEMTEAEANEKRQKFLDRNKVAAHKCRQRKKEWTDNLQNRSQHILFLNEALKMEVNSAYAEIAQLKMMVERVHQAPATSHKCNPERLARTEQKWQKFRAEEKTGFVESCSRNLAVQKAHRDRAGSSEQTGEDMSRHTSQQSHQSQQSSHSNQSSGFGRSERHDSGVSVNSPNSPEDAAKNLGTPKMNIDEGIDVSNNPNFFVGHTQVMPNQRLGGPIDLNDPLVYLNNMAH